MTTPDPAREAVVTTVKNDLPIPAEQIGGPAHPILANYIAWLILLKVNPQKAIPFGDQLLRYLEGKPNEQE